MLHTKHQLPKPPFIDAINRVWRSLFSRRTGELALTELFYLFHGADTAYNKHFPRKEALALLAQDSVFSTFRLRSRLLFVNLDRIKVSGNNEQDFAAERAIKSLYFGFDFMQNFGTGL
ncbi:hypothetical protein CEXT_182921 [Caerostris extrusa]|uniref:Uncharacterized protein n=1 Tax=Caerostris extrusa TaxID=172846 RepID=A0AAV4RWK7_CAEEX|nr:hypothetical protein CEXT_182921 [Caerostris extrusa]